jgi:hypothetical protein
MHFMLIRNVVKNEIMNGYNLQTYYYSFYKYLIIS